MKLVYGGLGAVFLGLIAFLAWLGQDGDNDITVFIGLILALVLAGLAALLGLLARGASDSSQKLYFAAIGTLIGALVGLAGGTAIGNQAAQTAASDVREDVENQVDRIAE